MRDPVSLAPASVWMPAWTPRPERRWMSLPNGSTSRALRLCVTSCSGLSRGPTEMRDDGALEGPVRHLYLHVDAELYTRAEEAAATAGVKIAPWLRSMVRQITLTDFPASWHEATPEERSHDSRIYGRRFMLRLDKISQTTLQQLITQFGTSKTHIIRQLIMQAAPEDFPRSWQIRAAERSVSPIRRRETKNHREVTR